MHVNSSPLAKLALLAGLLIGVGAGAQTTGTSLETRASNTQNFAGELAKADLAKKGVTTPTKSQLDASTQSIQGMRTSGMGWGQIANSLGLRLGDVVSTANREKHAEDSKHDESEKHSQAGRDDGRHDGNHGSSGGSSGRGGGNGGGGGHK